MSRKPNPPMPARNGRTRRIQTVVVWVLWLLIAAISAAGLRFYRVDNQVAEWMPQYESSDVVRSYLIVGFDSRDIQEPDVVRSLRSTPSVAACVDARSLDQGQSLLLTTAADFLVGPDGFYRGVLCMPRADVEDDLFVDEVRHTLRQSLGPGFNKIALGGPAVFHVELNRASQRRLAEAMIGIMAVGTLMIWWITRRFTLAAASMAAIALSQITLVGIIAWQGKPMDLAVSLVPPLMMALGFSYAAHRSLRHQVTGTLVLCAATTALGIGSFAAAGVTPIRHFALHGVLGLVLVWSAIMTLVPASPATRPAPLRSAPTRVRPWMAIGLMTCLGIVTRRRRTVIITCALVTLAAIPAAARLRFEVNPLTYFDPSDEVVVHFTTLNDRLTGMLPFEVSIRSSVANEAQTMLEHTAGVRKVIPLAAQPDAPPKRFWCLADNNALAQLDDAQSTWQNWSQNFDADLEWSGIAAQLLGTERVIKSIAITALPSMVIVAALAVGLLTRSPVFALISAWVNLLPVAVGILVVGLSQWPLSLPSLMIGAIAVGVAVDDTLHLMALHAEGRSVKRILIECWTPCAGSSFVAATCMAMFAISPFRPTAQFGLLMSVTIVVALVADMLLVPSAIAVIDRKPLQ